MVVVAGAAAVVRKVMVGGVLDVLVTALKQKPYTLLVHLSQISSSSSSSDAKQQQPHDTPHKTAPRLSQSLHVVRCSHC